MRILSGSLVLALSACSVAQTPEDYAASITSQRASCETRASGQCNFINSPVRLSSKEIILPHRALPFFKTRNDLNFIDAKTRKWVAPRNTLTDGASIPRVFIKVIGDPRSREFLNAATVHDAYCGRGNETGQYYHAAPWQSVHRMFYDGLRVGGTPAPKAKLMYAAVYLAGPRWSGLLKSTGQTSPTTSAGAFAKQQSNRSLPDQGVSDSQLLGALAAAKNFIATKNPTLDELEAFLTKTEENLLQEAVHNRLGEPDGQGHPLYNGNPGYNPSPLP
jgi:hypothetical protein